MTCVFTPGQKIYEVTIYEAQHIAVFCLSLTLSLPECFCFDFYFLVKFHFLCFCCLSKFYHDNI